MSARLAQCEQMLGLMDDAYWLPGGDLDRGLAQYLPGVALAMPAVGPRSELPLPSRSRARVKPTASLRMSSDRRSFPRFNQAIPAASDGRTIGGAAGALILIRQIPQSF